MSEQIQFPTDSIYWHDGQFIQPHHFQCLERQQRASLHQSEVWNTPFSYGLFSIKVSEEHLLEGKLVFDEIKCRLPDGAVVRFPEQHSIDQVNKFPESSFSSDDRTIRVYLGVAEVDSNRANTKLEGDPDVQARYLCDAVPRIVADENAADNPSEVDFRRIHPKILLGKNACEGFVTISLLQLKRASDSDKALVIDSSYIPPCIRQNAWSPLFSATKSAAIYLKTNAEAIASELLKAQVPGGSNVRPICKLDMHLQCLNSALGQLSSVSQSGHCHPFEVYQAFCRAAASVAYCRNNRTVDSFPSYSHDELGPLLRHLRRMLEADYLGLPYQRERFAVKQMSVLDDTSDEGRRFFSVLSCKLQQSWAGDQRQFFVGIRSKLGAPQVDRIILGNELSMKIGTLETVDQLFQHRKSGIRFSRAAQIPFDFMEQNWHFYEIHTTGESQSQWAQIETQLRNKQETNLGLRFADRHVRNMEVGESKAVIVHSGGEVELDFWLYTFQNSD